MIGGITSGILLSVGGSTETLVPSSSASSNWQNPSGTVPDDIDEDVGSGDDNVYRGRGKRTNINFRFPLGTSAVVDGDTVTKCLLRILCVSASTYDMTATLYFDGVASDAVTLEIGTTEAIYEFTHANWDIDRTAAEMDAIEVNLNLVALSPYVEIDAVNLDVTYTLA